MDFIQSFILALIEGITEFLPISSTGHLIIASKLLNMTQTDFVKSFEISIQSGAILAAIFLYWREVFLNKKILKNVFFAFIPTALIGFVLYKLVKTYLIGNLQLTLFMLVSGGVVIILLERFFQKQSQRLKIENLNTVQSLIIGAFQSLAVIPGVSRAAATILSGVGIGLERKEATKFSFMLAIPTMFAATGYDLLKSAGSFNSSELNILLVGFVVSFISALVTIKCFISFVQTRTLIAFGVYRIIAGSVLLLLLK